MSSETEWKLGPKIWRAFGKCETFCTACAAQVADDLCRLPESVDARAWRAAPIPGLVSVGPRQARGNALALGDAAAAALADDAATLTAVLAGFDLANATGLKVDALLRPWEELIEPECVKSIHP